MAVAAQDKQKEIAFFDGHAAVDAYDVFTPESNLRLLTTCMRLARLKPGARVADLGCGSGVFTDLLGKQGYHAVGLDLKGGGLGTTGRQGGAGGNGEENAFHASVIVSQRRLGNGGAGRGKV